MHNLAVPYQVLLASEDSIPRFLTCVRDGAYTPEKELERDTGIEPATYCSRIALDFIFSSACPAFFNIH